MEGSDRLSEDELASRLESLVRSDAQAFEVRAKIAGSRKAEAA